MNQIHRLKYISWPFLSSLTLVKMRGDWPFFGFWWNCWPSLFEFSFHNVLLILKNSPFLCDKKSFVLHIKKMFEDTKSVIRGGLYDYYMICFLAIVFRWTDECMKMIDIIFTRGINMEYIRKRFTARNVLVL